MESASIKISRKIQGFAKSLDKKIEKAAGVRVAFTLIIYTDNRASYISTCDRLESITELKKLIALWEKDMPDIPAHEVN